MVDLDAVVGFMVTWFIRKSRPGFGGTIGSQEVEDSLATLAELVTNKLGAPTTERLLHEVKKTTQLPSRSKDMMVVTLKSSVRHDPDFAQALNEAVTTLRDLTAEAEYETDTEHEATTSNVISGTVHGTVVQARDIHGDITFGR